MKLDGPKHSQEEVQASIAERKIPPELRPYKWQKNVNDKMWSAFALHPDADLEDIECDRRALRENVVKLVEISHRKCKPEYGETNLVRTSILVAATRLALAGQFGEMPDAVVRRPFCVKGDDTDEEISKLTPFDWQMDASTTMWNLFMLSPNLASTDTEADLRDLRENVARLVRLATQKGGGTGCSANHTYININDLPLIELYIDMAATHLVYAGYFGKV